jgi:hypothetical protein
MATILLVCFGNAIGDWKMQMGIEKSTRLSSWLIQGPGAAKMIVAAVHDRWVVASGGKIMLGRIMLPN